MTKHTSVPLIFIFLFTNHVLSEDLYSTNTPLINCEQGKLFLFNLCVTIIPYCNSYQNGGQCQSCDQTYVLSNGYCIPKALLSTTGSISLQTYFAQQPKIHSDIAQSSSLNKTCNNRQYLTAEGCQDIGLECLQFESNGTCTSCSENFYIYNGLCVEKIYPHKNNTPQNQNPNSNQLSTITETTSSSQNLRMNPSQTENSQSKGTNCFFSCATCSLDNPNYCTSCNNGFTTVDGIQGQCFSF